MQFDKDATEILSILRMLSRDVDSSFSTALLLYTLLQKPGTVAHNLLGALPPDLKARLVVESWHSARDMINPIPIEYIEFASKRIAEDLLPAKTIDSRHLLLICLVGDAFLGPGSEYGIPPTESHFIIGRSNSAVRALQSSGVDALGFLDTIRADPPLELKSPPSFYILWPEKSSIRVFRVEEMGEFFHQAHLGGSRPYPATLGLLDESVGKRLDGLLEFEALLNDPTTPELVFQKFFETNPDFLLSDDHVSVRPGFLLSGNKEIELRPDFFLQRRDSLLWDIGELKLPTEKLVRGRRGRKGLAAAVRSAMDQLREYRDYFLNESLSMRVQEKYGLEVYWPRLTLIIGRDKAFGNYRERQRHAPPEVRLLTYDDLLRFARHRSLLLPFGKGTKR